MSLSFAPFDPAAAETLSAAIDWAKTGGLIPAIIQDHGTRQVLMLGYMNADALRHTAATGQVTFWSRTKQRLWTKGESSGHVLQLRSVALDCDQDALLVTAAPIGPTCHTGTVTCFGDDPGPGVGFLAYLEQIIAARAGADPASSYTARLFARGLLKIAQKVGEEGVETALAAAAEPDRLTEEAADLLFHLLVLLKAGGQSLDDVLAVLRDRHLAARA